MSTVEDIHCEVERQVFERHAEVLDRLLRRHLGTQRLRIVLDPIPDGSASRYELSTPHEVFLSGEWYEVDAHTTCVPLHNVPRDKVRSFILESLGDRVERGTVIVPFQPNDSFWNVSIGLVYMKDEMGDTIEANSVENFEQHIREMISERWERKMRRYTGKAML